MTIAPKPASASTKSGQTPTRRLTSRDTPFASTRISPTFRRVTNVDAMPGAVALEELDQVQVRPDGDDQLRALLEREQQREVLADPGRRHGVVRARRARSSRAAPGAFPLPRYACTTISAPQTQRLVRDRVHVADDDVRLAADLEQRVGAAVDGDEHGLEVADVALDDPQVALHSGTARHDERVPVAEARAQRRELHRAGEHAALLAQVPHRVLGELLERLRHAPALIGERARQLVDAERASRRDAVAVPEDAAAAHRDELALAHRVEQLGAGDVDQLDAAAHEQQRPRVREAARSATASS